MDNIFDEIESQYLELATARESAVVAVVDKLQSLENGIETAKKQIEGLEIKISEAEELQERLIAQNTSLPDLESHTNDIVMLKLQLETANKALSASQASLSRLRDKKSQISKDRAHALRDLIANHWGTVQERFLVHLSAIRDLYTVWAMLPETLSEKHAIKWGKSAALEDPIRPLSFAEHGRDIKSWIEAAADWEQTRLRVNQTKLS